MDEKELARHDDIISLLRVQLKGTEALDTVPGLIEQIIDESMWADRIIRDTGQTITFDDFKRFVEMPPLAGLGTSVQNILDLCIGTTTQAKIEALLQAGHNSDASIEKPHENVIQASNGGSTRAYIIGRLKRDIRVAYENGNKVKARHLQQIIEDIIGQKISSHEGAVQAGFKPRTAQIYPRDIERTIKVLRFHFTEDELAELISLLLQESVSGE